MRSIFRHPYWAIIGYALVLGTATVLLRTMELHWLVLKPSLELYSGVVALVFLVLGIWLAKKINDPTPPAPVVHTLTVVNEQVDASKGASLGLSDREMEVLQGMAEGLSNAEIGEKLFLSTHTVKSHASRLFDKLEVKRRTQAIQKGKSLGLIRS